MANYAFNCDGQYYAYAANSAVHDVTSEDISLSAWVKASSGMGDATYVISKFVGVTGYRLWIVTGWIWVRIDAPVANYLIAWGNTDIRDDTRHHIAVTIDRNGTGKVYLDGSEDGTTNVGGAMFSNSLSNAGIFTLGADTDFNNEFDGDIADAKLYIAADDIWSDEEIAYQYRHFRSRSHNIGTITERWLCDEGSGLILRGSEGNDLIATSEEGWAKMPFEWTTKQKLQTYLDQDSTIIIGDGEGENYPLGDAERVEYDVVAAIKQYLSISFSGLPATPPDVLITAASKLSAAAIGRGRMGASMGNDLTEWTDRLTNEAWSSLQRIAISQVLDGATKRPMSIANRLLLTKTRERAIVPNV